MEPLSKRVEVTLKTLGASSATKSEISNLSSLHVGDIISGRIKGVKSYGLFIVIDDTNLVQNGLLMKNFNYYLISAFVLFKIYLKMSKLF